MSIATFKTVGLSHHFLLKQIPFLADPAWSILSKNGQLCEGIRQPVPQTRPQSIDRGAKHCFRGTHQLDRND